jgi:hypothetical protein
MSDRLMIVVTIPADAVEFVLDAITLAGDGIVGASSRFSPNLIYKQWDFRYFLYL